MSKQQTPFNTIVDTISTKSVMKQKVFENTRVVFSDLQEVIKQTIEELKKSLPEAEKNNIPIDYKITHNHEIRVTIAGDVIVFLMHTNVFQFDTSHSMWKSSYVQEDDMRSYCGIIYVYNFLKDSFKYERQRDLGYLIGRIFVNKDNHYFVEGKRQMGFLYNDFQNAVIDKKELRKILESVLMYALGFDLFIPAYDTMKQVSVYEMMEISKNSPMPTAKRLGYQFSADNAQPEAKKRR